MSSSNAPSFSDEFPSAKNFSIAIITASWHEEITSKLKASALQMLRNCGAAEKNLFVYDVPGSFELTAAASMAAAMKRFDAIICLGCVVQGETRHFEFICNAVANGLSNISIMHNIPVVFGVLTTDTLLQAHERAGGSLGNKGEEAAITAIKMASLRNELSR
jgi:6,7-dimethyl-8-ribityllumazine synthase